MSEACSLRIARLLTAIATTVAWFFISNHCVLADVQHVQPAKATCHQPCCGDRAPAKNKTQKVIECCKTLHATLAGAKDFAGYDRSLFALQLYCVRPIVFTVDVGATSRVVELDTGPPFVNTFAECVLQRSILAHAPPLLA